MRYAILADIHGNLEALQAVIEEIECDGPLNGIWCVGDLVGYGPNPNECIQLIRRYPNVCVLGNHDAAAVGLASIDDFNLEAATACRWTTSELSEENRLFLDGLPERAEVDTFTLVHGSPQYPLWEYLYSAKRASRNFRYFSSPCCLVGHTHVPLIFSLDGQSSSEGGGDSLYPLTALTGESRMILNPGSVGQPRDGDPRAAYAVYNSECQQIEYKRTWYDMTPTQKKMLEAGLPSSLAMRLSYGR